MMASGVFAGVLDQADVYAHKDKDGKSFGEELERIGWRGDEVVGARKIHAYYELHIEQGPILEDENVDIGVVTHGQGLKWLQVTLTGKEAHTGSTPMPKRRNASLGMARVIELVHEVAMDYQPDAVGAVGHIQVWPNSRNIIAGKAVFTIDIRSPNKQVLDEMDERIRYGIQNTAEALDIGFEIEQVGHFDPVTFDKTLVGNIREAAKELGYSYRDIVSGAGHDACWINRVAPSAMIMCPCVDGLSHNEAEEISKEVGGGRDGRAAAGGAGNGGDRGVTYLAKGPLTRSAARFDLSPRGRGADVARSCLCITSPWGERSARSAG